VPGAGRLPQRVLRAAQAITERIQAIHERSRGTYGVPRVHAETHTLKTQVLNSPRIRGKSKPQRSSRAFREVCNSDTYDLSGKSG
jgi:hypothetical protein